MTKAGERLLESKKLLINVWARKSNRSFDKLRMTDGEALIGVKKSTDREELPEVEKSYWKLE